LLFFLQGGLEPGKLFADRLEPANRGNPHGSREDIVGRLEQVDMIDRVKAGIVALRCAEDFQGPVGQDFIDIHIGRGTGAALQGIDHKLVLEGAREHLVTGLADGPADFRIDESVLEIGQDGGFFDLNQCPDQVRMHRLAQDREILSGSCGL